MGPVGESAVPLNCPPGQVSIKVSLGTVESFDKVKLVETYSKEKG